MNSTDPDRPDHLPEEVLAVLRRYSKALVSAYDAACEIQDLGLPGFHDPSAGDVVAWVRETGLGIPAPSEEEASAEAEIILRRLAEADRTESDTTP